MERSDPEREPRLGTEVESYQGLWKKYVEMRNMTMKAGEAEVGMNRSGSQLHRVLS